MSEQRYGPDPRRSAKAQAEVAREMAQHLRAVAKELSEKAVELKAQRDALLEALKEIEKELETGCDCDVIQEPEGERHESGCRWVEEYWIRRIIAQARGQGGGGE